MQTDPKKDYARGWVPFLDCEIYLDSRPLIPRMETEYWVEKAIEQCRGANMHGSGFKILDLFAGSGAIGIAALKHLPDARVDFGEIDASHFPTILKNIEKNNIDRARTRILETDVWSGVDGAYDFIFANPPYLSESRRERIQDSVLAHEPFLALFAEEDGFALVRKTVEGAAVHLAPEGALYIEHDPEQKEGLAALAHSAGMAIETRQDQFGLARYSILKPMA